MKNNNISSTSSLVFVFLVVIVSSSFFPAHSHGQIRHSDFLQCLNNSAISGSLYTPNNSSYSSILNSRIQNLRFTSPSTPKPLIIVTPTHESQIQAVVLCSKKYGIQIRTRSGGHDYEGLSYTSNSINVPFVVIDLVNHTQITVDAKTKTAWVQTGATLGQLYYQISQASNTLAFPAGMCPTVGIGGYLAGGGYGTLLRQYGLAADNVIDARLIDVNGRILDRKSMGEDLFWAIRGGGGASFGVLTAWKVNLVSVPQLVTVSSVTRTLDQNLTELIYKWQHVAPNLPNDIHITFVVSRVNSTIQATFGSLFLGRINRFLEVLQQRFPELGVTTEDCTEVRWIQSALFFGGYPLNQPTQVLASRIPLLRPYFKSKSDFVQQPISRSGLEGIWKLLHQREAEMVQVRFVPYGGKMNDIPESALPFPHRAGNLYMATYQVNWNQAGNAAAQRYINWMRRLYTYMTPYVSSSPRAAYSNYRDLDLGVNSNLDRTSYAQANTWGNKYFKNNFRRLVGVKTKVDPDNFFRNEQSIPPIHH